MTPREQAEQRMLFAKRRFREAARLALAGDPEAEAKASAAFVEIQAARAALARINDEQSTNERTGE